MATILLSAAGSAIGSGFGGTVLGLSGAVVGRAIGAAVGRGIDQRLLGSGSDSVASGKVENFRITGASYGSAIKQVWGRMRIPGQIIWASRFMEHVQASGGASGGKGSTRAASGTINYSYSISFAVALCEGEALSVGRVWANGVEVPVEGLGMRFYPGSEDQLPDPKIVATEGAENAPAYRGIAYVVFEDLQLGRFGNRVPQFSFEVTRNARRTNIDQPMALSEIVRAVALIPGTGEYSIATSPVHFAHAPGRSVPANVHTVQGMTDFEVSMRQLEEELPNCAAVSLVVSWFGDDLRCSHCQIKPKVEQNALDAANMPWVVSGKARGEVSVVPYEADRPIYGGTPSDESVVQAIRHLRDNGKEVMFYPFILMDQMSDNTLIDPWTGQIGQPALPWRGRITLNAAPGQPGSADMTPAAGVEVTDFLGSALASSFVSTGNTVNYIGDETWGYRRFILHYAHLCALAGGVDSFCVGSELRGLTRIRTSDTAFPMVAALRELAAEVKEILGSGTKVSYAADWSEYFGMRSGDDVLYCLDPLWADDNIDFIGIDNYMPLSDWRGEGPILAGGDSIYDLSYLEANVSGGEGYDWYYDGAEAIETGTRTAIRDTAYGEDWVFRYKDIKSWWSNEHFNRLGGVKQAMPTGWVPQSKPIRFTELGCPAVDRGTNEPNKFVDAGSSESALPRGSDGRSDDYIQMCYLAAMDRFWRSEKNNPQSTQYSGAMIDVDHSHVWAWDCRPYPEFPANSSHWSDGENYRLGHWLNGRTSNQPLSAVVADIMSYGGVLPDTSNLFGLVRGFESESASTARSKLQSLSNAFDFLVAEDEGIVFAENNLSATSFAVSVDDLVESAEGEELGFRQDVRSEAIERIRLSFYGSGGDFETASTESILAVAGGGKVEDIEMPLLLEHWEANTIAERVLARAWHGRDQISFKLGPSHTAIRAGARATLDGRSYRIASIEDGHTLSFEGVRVDDAGVNLVKGHGSPIRRPSPAVATPVSAVLFELPLLNGEEVPHAPYVAVSSNPWPGPVSVWHAGLGSDFLLNTELSSPTVIGVSLFDLDTFRSDLWDRGSRLQVLIGQGTLSSLPEAAVLSGGNLAAIGGGSSDAFEVFHYSSANLIGDGVYELSGLLRGIGGTLAIAPDYRPAGSTVVFLGPSVEQLDLPLNLLGLDRQYRIGPTELGYTDRNVVSMTERFTGAGLRPLTVCHLQSLREASGTVNLRWIRRSRIGGDSWELAEIPLGEDTEAYQVRVRVGASIVREATVNTPEWTYPVSQQASDGAVGAFSVEVAQVSGTFGSGPFVSILVT